MLQKSTVIFGYKPFDIPPFTYIITDGQVLFFIQNLLCYDINNDTYIQIFTLLPAAICSAQLLSQCGSLRTKSPQQCFFLCQSTSSHRGSTSHVKSPSGASGVCEAILNNRLCFLSICVDYCLQHISFH